MQDLSRAQSLLTTHSGRQPLYGSPKYSGRQVQEPAPLRSRHSAFGPQGEGEQGVKRSSGTTVGCGLQPANGSPEYPLSQLQTGE